MSQSRLYEDDEGYIIVYTDGCCYNNGRGGAKAGIGVWFADNHQLNVSAPLKGRATNQRAELQAVVAACKRALAAGIDNLFINTDSHYAMNCSTKWIYEWRRNGWINARGNPVANQGDIQEMMHYVEQLNVKWKPVPSHSGIYGNERADYLARQGAKEY